MEDTFKPIGTPGKERLPVTGVLQGDDVELFLKTAKRLNLSKSRLAAQAIHFALAHMRGD